MRTTMEKLDLFKGMTLSDEEIFVIHGGISIAEEGGIICGGGCNGDDGGGCGILAVMTNLPPSKKSSKISHKDIFVDFIILKRICVTHILSN